MSTLVIPPKRVRLYRVLWDRWIIVLRILFDLGAASHPVKWRAVADTLLVDKKTAQKYLGGLIRDGHLAIAGEGYMLTDAGMSLLQEHEYGEFIPLEGKILGETFSPLVVEVVDLDSESKSLTPPTPKLGKIPGETFSPLTKLIIAHIPDLFDGSQLITDGLPWVNDEFQSELLLGWLAYVYEKRTTFARPVGLLYSKLQRDERPPMEFMKSYDEYLPESFLDKVGLLEKVCPRCEQVFQHLADFTEHSEICLYTPQEEPDEPTPLAAQPDETITPEFLSRWQTLLDQLQEDMPRAAFDTWVRDTVPLHIDADVLKVATRNQYACNWLRSRMTKTMELQMANILGRPLYIGFCVAVETEG